MAYLKKRADKREVVCPYCKEKKSDKAYQEEILGILFSLMAQETLPSLELRPDMKVKTVTKLTRETKVILSNIAIAAPLFFKLLSMTFVTIRNSASLVGDDDSLGWCIGELGCETRGRTKISVYGCSKEEAGWICANTNMEENRTPIPWKIRRDEKNVCAFLKCWAGVSEKDMHNTISLGLSEEEPTEEILGEGNNSIWVGKMERLELGDYAVGILPKLRLHEENVMEELVLSAEKIENITEILKEENFSIWIGKMKRLVLGYYAVEILPKLRIPEENVLEVFMLNRTDYSRYITEILKEENKSIRVGKVKSLELMGYAIQILPKLRFHEENEMRAFCLYADHPSYIIEILGMENSSIWAGKLKKLKLYNYAVEILPKLRIHEENVMEYLGLDVDYPSYITSILKAENNSIWVGKVETLHLEGYSIAMLPKLRIPGGNEMEKLVLVANRSEDITETPQHREQQHLGGEGEEAKTRRVCNRNTSQTRITRRECSGGDCFECIQP
ncbi:MAG: uncharacterized protein A8A55_1476 [Amphiamblys sp. WSBS2006]|nr:MAG: uncharacterized protein A8A55_1476 [Amphiamblys sp. WSBS2006]